MATEDDKTPDVVIPEDTTNYEELARVDGWVSQEEWVAQGKPETLWKPAKEFYEVGQQILPVVNAKNKRLERELQDLQGRMAKLAKANETSLKLQQDAYEKELKAAKAKAIRDGDGDKVNDLDDELAKIRQVRTAPQSEPTPDPITAEAFQQFRNRNPWYGTDRGMSVYADVIAEEIKAQDPSISGPELLLKTEFKVKEKFNMATPVSKKPTATAVEPSTRAPTKPASKKSYEALPSEAKQACDNLLRAVPASQRDSFKTRYVDSYYSNED